MTSLLSRLQHMSPCRHVATPQRAHNASYPRNWLRIKYVYLSSINVCARIENILFAIKQSIKINADNFQSRKFRYWISVCTCTCVGKVRPLSSWFRSGSANTTRSRCITRNNGALVKERSFNDYLQRNLCAALISFQAFAHYLYICACVCAYFNFPLL